MSVVAVVGAFVQVLGENLLEKITPAAPLLAFVIGGPTALIPLAMVYPLVIAVAVIAPYVETIGYFFQILGPILELLMNVIGYPHCIVGLVIRVMRYNIPLVNVRREIQELSGNPPAATDFFTTVLETIFSQGLANGIVDVLRAPIPSACGI